MFLAAAAVLAGTLVKPASADSLAVVRTADGAVRGTVTEDHRIFQGIRYARPPVGDLRLSAPRPNKPWSGVRDATQPGPWCAQVYAYPPGTPPQFAGDEDCLYLNVDVPRGVGARLPVMVFLHGGGFNGGSGAGYDPRRVTADGRVIAVTINYRLGALGFLRHPSLHDPYAGNFGIADQQLALRWVRRNIAAFGGDPRNVTLWGESAGGFSVCAQLASPLASGLFDKAIVQSAPCGNDLLPRAEADARGRVVVAGLGCGDAADVAACLRRLPARQLATPGWGSASLARHVTDAFTWLPTAGTMPIPLQPLDATRKGLANDVPLIQGGTREEMRAFVAEAYDGIGKPVTAEQYPRIVGELFGKDAAKVLAEYPHTDFETPSIALATALTDEGGLVGACSQLPYDATASRRAPVYVYEFAEPTDDVVGGLPLLASHGTDIPYFFDSYLGPTDPLTGPRQRLAKTLIGHWTAFARTGRPAAGWHPYRDGVALSFATSGIGEVDVRSEHRCEFWRSL